MERLLIFSVLCIYPLVATAQPTNEEDYEKGWEEVRTEIKAIPKEELGGQSSCSPTDTPYGFGYYLVGAGLIGTKDLAIAVYNARNSCDFMYKGSNHPGGANFFCRVGVDVAMRNLDGGKYNLKKCYKEKYTKNVPTKDVIK